MKKIILSLVALGISAFAHQEINSIDEYRALTNSGKVVIDFYAPWCLPCKELSKSLRKVNWSAEGIKVYKVNVEKHPEIQREFALNSGFAVPFLVIKDNGRITKEHVGVMPIDDIEYYSNL